MSSHLCITTSKTTADGRIRRYTFRNQPEMCNWNVAQLANALLAAELMPLVGPLSQPLRHLSQPSPV